MVAYKDLVEEWPGRIKTLFRENTDEQQKETIIDMQLQFLRAATCMKLILDALD